MTVLLCPDCWLYLLHDFTKDLEGMLIKFTNDTVFGCIADTVSEVLGCKIVLSHISARWG